MNDTTDSTDESNPHAGLEFTCPTKVGEPQTRTVEHGDGETHEETYRERCGTTLTYEDDYIGMARTTEARKNGYEETALKFRCPDCGDISYRCPICADSNRPGWFKGESSGDLLACHNCNAKEAARQRKERF
jgi:DNA-directed RNA polymerase subunit RPC12/RpoP